ncbi:MAG: mechanosensitive ion channel family protein [Chitinophagaceae bacterium]|jgi:MscS family membrane protein
MKSFLQYQFLSNSIQSYLIVLAVIFLVFLFKKYLSRYLAVIIFKCLQRTSISLKKEKFVALVVKPIEFFLLVMVSYIAFDNLHYPKYLSFQIFNFKAQQVLECLVNTTLVVIFIWMCLRIIDFIAILLEEKANHTKDNTDNQLVIFFKDFFKAILVIIGVLLILKFGFSRDVTSLLTGLSIVGAAIALATRESLENLIASFIIFFDKPFTIGDVVKVQSFTGTVEKIGLRSTRLRTESKTYVSVPNKQMVDSIIDNLSLRTLRKGELKLDFAINTSVQNLQLYQQQLNSFLASQIKIIKYEILLMDTGKDAHHIQVDYFTDIETSIDEFNLVKQTINYKAISVAEDLNLQFYTTT